MMMNKNFDPEKLLTASETLKANDKWVIFTHVKSDGDALGSASALFEAGVNAGKIVSWFSPDEKLPETYKYLAHFDDCMTCEKFSFDDDGTLYVFLDCSTEIRSVAGFDINNPLNSLNIDHHEDNTNYARVNCVDGLARNAIQSLYGWELGHHIEHGRVSLHGNVHRHRELLILEHIKADS